jgi:hypothetical protein
MSLCPNCDEKTVPNLPGLLCDLASQSVRFGVAFWEAWRVAGAEKLEHLVSRNCFSYPLAAIPRHSGCKIPPPCWVPKSLGDVTSAVCPGAAATLRIRVTNCGVGARNVRVEVPGTADDLKNISISPPSLTLQPQERGSFSVTATVPPDAPCPNRKEYLVWVRGCYDYYFRWTVISAHRGDKSCHEISVDDCPDLIHHWYDHFYCDRPCPSAK